MFSQPLTPFICGAEIYIQFLTKSLYFCVISALNFFKHRIGAVFRAGIFLRIKETSKIKILVIDDEPDELLMICVFFEPRGYEVFTTLDGVEGAEICLRENPDLVMLDLKLKQGDAKQMIPWLKNLAPAVKIFVISGYQEENIEEKILRLGADRYFEKPVSIIEIEWAVRTILNQ